MLLKRGADCCLEDGNGQLPDDIARQHMCYDCEQLIESHRKHRTEHIFKLVDNVNQFLIQDTLDPAYKEYKDSKFLKRNARWRWVLVVADLLNIGMIAVSDFGEK